MKHEKKVIAGVASIIGAACTVGLIAKVTARIKRKSFDLGFAAGHFDGFIEGGIAVAKKYDKASKAASTLRKEFAALEEKYTKLCKDYDELESEYSDLYEEYYKA